MPELPEVETIKIQLSKNQPYKIKKVQRSKESKSIIKKEEFTLEGLTIKSFSRHGKMLIFNLSDDKLILSHLGMSGSWRLSTNLIEEKHTHFQLEVTAKRNRKYFLAYVDPRRFGNIYIITKESAQDNFKKLGPDVSSSEFNVEHLLEMKRRFPEKVLKPFLLDQKFFAGIGNYMASEICARAQLLPTRKMKSISKPSLQKIILGTQEVLDQTISQGGTAFSGGYSDTNGEKGEGVKNLVVFYQNICKICNKTEVKKITLATRGTYYCPRCQK